MKKIILVLLLPLVITACASNTSINSDTKDLQTEKNNNPINTNQINKEKPNLSNIDYKEIFLDNKNIDIKFLVPEKLFQRKDYYYNKMFRAEFYINADNPYNYKYGLLNIYGINDEFTDFSHPKFPGYCAVVYDNLEEFCQSGECKKVDKYTAYAIRDERSGGLARSGIIYTTLSDIYPNICFEMNASSKRNGVEQIFADENELDAILEKIAKSISKKDDFVNNNILSECYKYDNEDKNKCYYDKVKDVKDIQDCKRFKLADDCRNRISCTRDPKIVCYQKFLTDDNYKAMCGSIKYDNGILSSIENLYCRLAYSLAKNNIDACVNLPEISHLEDGTYKFREHCEVLSNIK